MRILSSRRLRVEEPKGDAVKRATAAVASGQTFTQKFFLSAPIAVGALAAIEHSKRRGLLTVRRHLKAF